MNERSSGSPSMEKYLGLAVDIFQGSLIKSSRNLLEDIAVTEMARLLQEKENDKAELEHLRKELKDLKEQRWKDLGVLESADRGSKFEEIKEKHNMSSKNNTTKSSGLQKGAARDEESPFLKGLDESRNWFPGCECSSCRNISAQTPRNLMSRHSNWPRPGSWLLLKDNRFVQLVYLGHDPQSRDPSIGVVVLESKGDVIPKFYRLSEVERFNGQLLANELSESSSQDSGFMEDVFAKRSVYSNTCCGHTCFHCCRSGRVVRKLSEPIMFTSDSDWAVQDTFSGYENTFSAKKTILQRLAKRGYSLS